MLLNQQQTIAKTKKMNKEYKVGDLVKYLPNGRDLAENDEIFKKVYYGIVLSVVGNTIETTDRIRVYWFDQPDELWYTISTSPLIKRISR